MKSKCDAPIFNLRMWLGPPLQLLDYSFGCKQSSARIVISTKMSPCNRFEVVNLQTGNQSWQPKPYLTRRRSDLVLWKKNKPTSIITRIVRRHLGALSPAPPSSHSQGPPSPLKLKPADHHPQCELDFQLRQHCSRLIRLYSLAVRSSHKRREISQALLLRLILSRPRKKWFRAKPSLSLILP